MPFKSEKQRKYLYANQPKLAKKWSNMYGKKITALGSVPKDELEKVFDAIKFFEKKIKSQGMITNARDEEQLKRLKKYFKDLMKSQKK